MDFQLHLALFVLVKLSWLLVSETWQTETDCIRVGRGKALRMSRKKHFKLEKNIFICKLQLDAVTEAEINSCPSEGASHFGAHTVLG